ncbi:uncharacterized protein LOC128629337 [Ictalurus punctatus]|uniref:Uncharacterized protein LOC128629337 n=1 Tax=Ictalurus punctatus TaxID=7998 RepID=A0A9F7RAK8_ICTPU|nr:uncharacterized protein LOC128629337 [Ictalurus punctatus]
MSTETEKNKEQSKSKTELNAMGVMKLKVKYFEVVPETVSLPSNQFTAKLQKERKSMEKSTKEDCKVVLFYLPIVSRAGNDIEAALQKLNDFEDKYIALVVLHHTYDPEMTVPDSSRAVIRENIITVDCLFYEDKGLLQCRKNDEAVKKVAAWLKIVKHLKQEKSENKKNKEQSKSNTELNGLEKINLKVKYFEVVPETVSLPSNQFTAKLKKERKSMKKSTKEDCKAVLFYLPIVSRAGTDIEAALQNLNDFEDKYIAIVMLHHTYNPEITVPDSSRAVIRENIITVDCLFHEDKGLLQCRKNDEAVKKVAAWLKIVKHLKQEKSEKKQNGESKAEQKEEDQTKKEREEVEKRQI